MSEKKRRVGSRKNKKKREYAPVWRICPFVLRCRRPCRPDPVARDEGGTGILPIFIGLEVEMNKKYEEEVISANLQLGRLGGARAGMYLF